LQVTSESVALAEASPSLDNAGRPLVDLVVSILRDECHYRAFHSSGLLSHDSDASFELSVPDRADSTQRPRVIFNPSLVARLGTIARKLIEVIEVIHKSSSADLAGSTEIWRQQWHNEAYSFIANISDQKVQQRTCSIAACNRCCTIPPSIPPPLPTASP